MQEIACAIYKIAGPITVSCDLTSTQKMTSTGPSRAILIGKGRRITIDELISLAVIKNGKLEAFHATGDEEKESTSGIELDMSKLDLNDSVVGTALSEASSKAVICVLALATSQCRLLNETESMIVSNALISLCNSESSTSLPSDPSDLAKTLSSYFSSFSSSTTSLSSFFEKILPKVLQRVIPVAISALSAGKARYLVTASDCSASLSAERLEINPTLCFADTFFDMLRPHRGCISTANTLRAILQGSTFAKASTTKKKKGGAMTISLEEEVISDKQAIQNTPQYSGPARESILAACKTMELEMNCSEPKPGMELDSTIVEMAATSTLNAINALSDGCMKRAGKDSISGTNIFKNDALTTSLLLEKAVNELKTSLESEITTNLQYLHAKANDAQIAAQKKDAEKTARAAAHQKPVQKENEFEGMTEAQIKKILKKRAEKEAKAAKKAKNKGSGGGSGDPKTMYGSVLSSLFGMGTGPLMTLLTDPSTGCITNEKLYVCQNPVSIALTPSVVAAMTIQIEKLLSGGVQRKPKIAKGTRDYLPSQMMIRQQAFSIIRRVFESHGAVEIDTPVFELKETLTGKYGEDSKLIYDLADQGGELLALRYDLTVPFARFLALNPVGNIKRFHIGKVYRRDQPALSRGRYREFYQCDFDIAGKYGRMIPDSECLGVACEILDTLPIGDFGIKLNHRKLLDAILDLCGVPSDKFRTICSAVDKLDKEPWEEVKREMIEDKGLKEEVADKIGKFVLKKGEPWEMYNSLMEGNTFGTHDGALTAMEDLRILFQYLEAMDKLRFISFDLSLARGLDYYTGVIYEAVCMSGNTQVGSIGGGGRYDNLVSMFQEAGKITPCVGVSVGIERVFTLMEANLRSQSKDGSVPKPNVTVLIASAGSNSSEMICEKMKIANVLWKSKISCEFTQTENIKLKNEITNALERDIPFMVVVGEEEAKERKCKLKDLKARTEDLVSLDELVKILLKEKGILPVGCEFAKEFMEQLA